MKRPVIGITSEIVNLGIDYHPSARVIALNEEYKNLVAEKGAIPIIIPMTKDKDLMNKYIDMCDGFLFTGGADINPLFYGENPNHALGSTDYDRDEFEIQLMKKVLKKDKPILAICRGIQILNIVKGGTLIQHIPDDEDYFNHMTHGSPGEVFHSVSFEKNNLLYDLFGEKINVNSSHHQGLGKVGDGIKIIGKADDGMIEAVKLKDHDFVYGVQWHPEGMVSRDESMYLLVDEFLKETIK